MKETYASKMCAGTCAVLPKEKKHGAEKHHARLFA